MNEAAAFAVLTFSSLLAIVNPIAAVPVFLAVTADQDAERRRHTVMRAVTSAVLILVVFAALGPWILGFFGITTYAFRIAGGVIFFMIGWDMLQARRSRVKTTEEEEGEVRADPAIIPLGIPTIAGPGAITTVIALVGQAPDWLHVAAVYVAIAAVALVTALVLLTAPAVLRRLGQTGLNVITRIMGLLVMVVGTQFVIDGVHSAVRELGGL